MACGDPPPRGGATKGGTRKLGLNRPRVCARVVILGGASLGPREAAHLPDELEGGGADLFVRGRWLEVMQGLDAPEHPGGFRL